MTDAVEFVHAARLDPDMLAWGRELADLRREAHKNPELGFDTPRTVERIVRTLKSWGN